MKGRRVAVILPNYNMPEAADFIAEWLYEDIEWPFDLYLVDNGSDLTEPAENTTVWLHRNMQTCRGWLEGLEASDRSGQDYFAYWFMITSMKPVSRGIDMLAGLMETMLGGPYVGAVHPALTKDSTTAWEHMKTRMTWGVRPTWMVDNIAALWRADWFNSIGRFDKDMSFAWGVDLETCLLARRHGRSMWIDDRVLVHKTTNVAYDMDRMNMKADKRSKLAYAEMERVLSAKYGPDWSWTVRNEKVEPEWR